MVPIFDRVERRGGGGAGDGRSGCGEGRWTGDATVGAARGVSMVGAALVGGDVRCTGGLVEEGKVTCSLVKAGSLKAGSLSVGSLSVGSLSAGSLSVGAGAAINRGAGGKTAVSVETVGAVDGGASGRPGFWASCAARMAAV